MVRQVTLLAGGKISSYQPVRIAASGRGVSLPAAELEIKTTFGSSF